MTPGDNICSALHQRVERSSLLPALRARFSPREGLPRLSSTSRASGFHSAARKEGGPAHLCRASVGTRRARTAKFPPTNPLRRAFPSSPTQPGPRSGPQPVLTAQPRPTSGGEHLKKPRARPEVPLLLRLEACGRQSRRSLLGSAPKRWT